MTLNDIFNLNRADKGTIGHGFALRYEPLIQGWRNETINLLECGIQFGLSARGWLEYFPKAQIFGVDCGDEHGITDPRFHFQKANQRDAAFWQRWKQSSPRMHVIIDDAEHRADASKIMFDALWPHLLPGGVYAIEDTCCWWDDYFSSPFRGQTWIGELAAAVNQNGKAYGGKPNAPPNVALSPLESSLYEMHISKHLCILIKA